MSQVERTGRFIQCKTCLSSCEIRIAKLTVNIREVLCYEEKETDSVREEKVKKKKEKKVQEVILDGGIFSCRET